MAARLAAGTLMFALGTAGVFAVAGAPADPSPSTSVATTTAALTVTVASRIDGKPVEWWARRARSNGRTMRARARTVRRLKRTLNVSPTIQDAIALSSVVYRVPRSTLFRKAQCESRFSPAARNPSGAAGLYQFLPSTWRTTPFAGFSPYDPLASALAAGWMHLVGRGGEWSCR
jgi:soluble lytic murein transglycosylase-like protein